METLIFKYKGFIKQIIAQQKAELAWLSFKWCVARSSMLSDSDSGELFYNSVSYISDSNVKFLLLTDMQILSCPVL